MRLDLFLKKTSLIKRRAVAKEIVERGMVTINSKVAKPSSDVRDSDIIVLTLGPKIVKAKAIITIKKEKEVPDYEMVRE